MQARPSVPGIERSSASALSLDTERRVNHQRSRDWTPTSISLFGHDISVDVLTGNLVISCRDVGYRFHDFLFGITRHYDAQEQFMRQCHLRDFVNVNPRRHWFGNWRFAYEADIEEVWHQAPIELHISSGVGVNALFLENGEPFRRNHEDAAKFRSALNTYGIPNRTLAVGALDWSFANGDFLLRSIRGQFQIAAGYFRAETLVDPMDSRVWVFNPASGTGFLLSSEHSIDVDGAEYREVGQGMIARKLVDALGHAIELKPVGAAPFPSFLLSDGSGREIQLDLDAECTYRGDHGRMARQHLVSKVRDKSKAAYGDTDYKYDPDHYLAHVQLPSSIGNRCLKYTYHASLPGVLAAIENSKGDKIQFEYEEDMFDCDERLNPRVKVRKITDPEGMTFEYAYDNVSRCTAVTVKNNGVVERTIVYRYIQDKKGTKKRYLTATETEVKTGYKLDAAGGVVDIPAGSPQRVVNRTEYSEDGRFNVVRVIDPLNRAIGYSYNDFNQVQTLRDFDGHITNYQFDIPPNPPNAAADNPIGYDLVAVTHENLVRSINPASASGFSQQIESSVEEIQFACYDANNTAIPTDIGVFSTHRMSKKIDALLNIWQYAYNDVNNFSCLLPTVTTAPSGSATHSTYNNRGERTGVTDAEGNVHVCTFNAQGGLEEYTDPNQGKMKFRYFPCGNWLLDIRDQALKVTTFHRYPDGMVSQIVDAMNDSVDFRYFRNERLNRIVKHRPAIAQDPVDVALRTADLANVTSEMEYSALGELVSAVNGNGLELRFTFDEAGRMCAWFYSDPGLPQKLKYVYDAAGQLVAIVDKSSDVTSFSYNNSGYLKTARFPSWNDGAANIPGKNIDYTYDYFGRILSATDSEFGGVREYCYDKLGAMLMRCDPGGHTFHFKYDSDGRLYEAFNENGSFGFWATLDNLNRIEALHDSDALDGKLNWRYYYEKGIVPNKRVLSLFRREQVELGFFCDFDYDVKNRLIKTTTSGSLVLHDQTILYRDDDLIAEMKGSSPDLFMYDGLKQLVFESLEPAHQDYDRAVFK